MWLKDFKHLNRDVLLSVFLFCPYPYCVSQWTADTVDQILTGDALYVKAFDDGTIPDTETLSLTHLPDRVRWPNGDC